MFSKSIRITNRKSRARTRDITSGHLSRRFGAAVAEALEGRRLLAASYVMSTLFNQFGTNDTGTTPQCAPVVDSAGNVYGTSNSGGAYGDGTVFEIAKGSGAVATLASFNGSNGANPAGGLALDSTGNLYGTTENGGIDGDGTVFEVAAGSGAITTVASFNGSNGAQPQGGVTLDPAGNLYGTTQKGGVEGGSTVFEIATGSGVITTLASDVGTPAGGITLDSAGDLYLATAGAVIEMAATSHVMTTLGIASLSSSDGFPVAGGVTLDSAGNLYGATEGGGSFGQGAVFEIAADSGVVTTLASFNGSDQIAPTGGVTLDSAGNLYGLTNSGGSEGRGSLYEVAKGSGAVTTLTSFNDTNGSYPLAGLTIDAAGNLYGTTAGGGTVGDNGTVFEVPAGNGAITTLASLNGTNGANPQGGVTLDSAGNLYGTATNGGSYGWGSIFEIPAGSSHLTTLASFNTGYAPSGGSMAVDPAGNLYEAVQESVQWLPGQGGDYGYGAVFELPAGSSTMTTLASFNGSNGYSPNGLTRDAAGNLYGTTGGGGAFGDGAVFEVAAGSDTITTLASFDGTDGVIPYGGLTLDSAGNLYGTTYCTTMNSDGSASGGGTVFEIAAGTHAITTLARFNGGNGANPFTGLTLDSAGDLFGTTENGGTYVVSENGGAGGGDTGGGPAVASGVGTVFEIPAGSGTITTLATFNGADGAIPQGTIVLDAAGNLFGTTESGGTYGDGTVFEIPAGSGSINTLVSFNSANGAQPFGGLTADAAGDLFGTTQLGGNGNGTVFELRPTTPVAAISGPQMGVQYQTLSLTFSATDVLPATDAAGYQYQIDWGDGSALQTIAAAPGNGAGIDLGHVFTAPGSYNVSVTVLDSDGLSSQPVRYPVQITQDLSLSGGTSGSIQSTLQDIADNLQQSTTGSATQPIQVQVADQTTLDNLLSAISGLQVSSAPTVDITVNASNSTYADTQVSVPPNVVLTLNGATFVGGSPALIVASGSVVITNSTLTNSTNAPTILVEGGNLLLRGDVIRQSSTIYARPAIEVDGGMVDLGSASTPGGNTLDVDDGGMLVDNATGNPNAVPIDPAAANIFEMNGAPITSNSGLEGEVWVDFNNDGNVDFGEQGINGVTITLTGTDTLGRAVQATYPTGTDGIYTFASLWPGLYTITETGGPALSGFLPGIDSKGTLGAASVSQGVFSNVTVPAAQTGFYYNFGQQPAPGSTVHKGQAAGIGFWANKNGQMLLMQMASNPPLGQWLADTLPQVFGNLATASPSDITGLYRNDFLLKDKLAAQYMATALNVYATNSSLGGSYAQAYGFSVGQYGLGDSTWNVGADGHAFAVADDTTLTVMQLLQDGQAAVNSTDSNTRKMVLDVFGGINGAGGM